MVPATSPRSPAYFHCIIAFTNENWVLDVTHMIDTGDMYKQMQTDAYIYICFHIYPSLSLSLSLSLCISTSLPNTTGLLPALPFSLFITLFFSREKLHTIHKISVYLLIFSSLKKHTKQFHNCQVTSLCLKSQNSCPKKQVVLELLIHSSPSPFSMFKFFI